MVTAVVIGIGYFAFVALVCIFMGAGKQRPFDPDRF